MTHWLGKKYKISIPTVMQKVQKGAESQDPRYQYQNPGIAQMYKAKKAIDQNLAQSLYRKRGNSTREIHLVRKPLERTPKTGKDGLTYEKK